MKKHLDTDGYRYAALAVVVCGILFALLLGTSTVLVAFVSAGCNFA